ncbi:hypothetical protein CARUB_v10027485mg [Capsella rubella]|uniref:Uncharacterized protein n=1 Tax=Capsella rubella TaxID=81985 RepID=R0EZB7_9BRAS|nr:hypothetical protein CARUB_v10027485mg [Capsella rubella]EOA14317.1 hypothetical protein CARUB_v10027485mg [Capsella rubella]
MRNIALCPTVKEVVICEGSIPCLVPMLRWAISGVRIAAGKMLVVFACICKRLWCGAVVVLVLIHVLGFIII